MDKKNTIIGVALLMAAMGLMFWQNRQAQEAAQQERQRQVEQAAQAAEAARQEAAARPAELEPGAPLRATAPDAGPAPLRITPAEQAAPEAQLPAELNPVLENDFIRVRLTSWGGAIESVAFLKYPAVQDRPDVPYVFNAHGDLPALALARVNNGKAEVFAPAYEVVEQTPDRVVFRREVEPGVTFERVYTIRRGEDGAEPYTVQHRTVIANATEHVVNPDFLYFSLGTAAPEMADSYGQNLTAGYYNGEDYNYENIGKFTGGGGFLFFKSDPLNYMEAEQPVVWAAVKNQFFASILTPAKPGNGVFLDDVILPARAGGKVERGLTGAVRFELPAIASGESASLDMDLYTGPKEYNRLATLDKEQDRVMQFGWNGFGGGPVSFVGKVLYSVLTFIQDLVVNWGVAIILLTIFVRLLFWPLTAKAAESSRKMTKLQAPLKALREKYKDNPHKLNQETMALWKKHKVNPAAGCLPVLIQIPIFLGLYYMLRAASELRFQHFLWVQDLSLPDTVAHISGFPVNILPLFMGVSMFFQMRLAPTPGMDATQAKIMRYMPLIFLFFCYNFASGLVLYWTMSNCMSILQQLHTNHKRRKEDEAEAGGNVVTASTSTAPATGTNVQKRQGQKPKGKKSRQ